MGNVQGMPDDAAQDEVLLTRDGAVVTITLNRPETLNALTAGMLASLADAVAEVADTDARVVVLTGAGRGFCSGADLRRALGDTGQEDPGAVIDACNRAVLTMQTMPQPVVAAVRGPAVGMGCGLALACDLVLAAQSATFSLPFTGIGLMPDGGASVLIPASLGRTRAMTLALLGDRLTAAEALQAGMASRVLPDVEFDAAVHEVVARLATGAGQALAATKRAVNAVTLPGLADGLAAERDGQVRLLGTSDFAEAIAAFSEKRPPHFTGA